jgi:hypothetical protein
MNGHAVVKGSCVVPEAAAAVGVEASAVLRALARQVALGAAHEALRERQVVCRPVTFIEGGQHSLVSWDIVGGCAA